MVSPPERLQRITRFTPLDDVLGRIAARVARVEPRRAEASAALGAILADDVVVDGPVPPTALALRDGWAVASELTADASSYGPMPLAAAVRVNAGEALPPGADAVAALDTVSVRDGEVEALASVVPGEGVLPQGGDLARAGLLLEAGRRLGSLELALLRAASVASLRVRAPRVRLARVRTGSDHIVVAAAEWVTSEIRRAGGRISADASESLEHALIDAGVDAVIAVGGTGVGTNDRTVSTMASLGELIVHGVALVPGETTAFGIVEARPVLALPGRLDAAAAAWHMLGRAILTQLTGTREPPSTRMAKLTHKITSSVGFAELVPVRTEGLFATPIAAGYVPLSALAQANGWVYVPPASEGYPAHRKVMIRPWP
jgi:molybdopterin molybdotransferase